MSDTVQVRPARAEDKPAIVAFCQNTFSWGDYIADAWDNWMADPNGKLFVGVVDEQPVAMMHVAFLKPQTAWMEGMRVHPDFRRRRLGTTVDVAGRAYARDHGYPLARLATSIKNTPAQEALVVQGYTQVARFNSWVAQPMEARPPQMQVATQSDRPAILAAWEHSHLRAATRGLLPDPYWHWTELTGERLKQEIDAGQARLAPGAFMLCSWADDDHDNGIFVHALVGDQTACEGLAEGARIEAGYRGFKQTELMLADDAASNAWLQRAGFELSGGMLIYEQVWQDPS